jgi:hypothetical protein
MLKVAIGYAFDQGKINFEYCFGLWLLSIACQSSWWYICISCLAILQMPFYFPAVFQLIVIFLLFLLHWELLRSVYITFIIQLSIFDCRTIRLTPHHLFGSDRSPDLGTGTLDLVPAFIIAFSIKVLHEKVKYISAVSLSIALNASGGTWLSPDALQFLSS